MTDTTPVVPRLEVGVGAWSGEVFAATKVTLRGVTWLKRPSEQAGGVPRLDGTLGAEGNGGRCVCSATGNGEHSRLPGRATAYKTGGRAAPRDATGGGRRVAATYIALVQTIFGFP